MTPKEKAIELVEKYILLCEYGLTEIHCALIAVDEIIKSLSSMGIPTSYWQEVKQEIEKL
jgi:hypothetical protein